VAASREHRVIGQYGWLRLAAPVVGRLPGVFYPVAAAAGWLAWHIRPHAREELVRNMLPLCDGDLDRARRESRLAYRNIARYWVDVTTVPHRDFSRFETRHIRFIDEARLEVLRRAGPVLIVSAHTGGAELSLQAMTARGRRFTALVEDIQPGKMAHYLNRLRSSAGGVFEPANRTGVRAALAALRRGEVVGLMADRDLQGTGVCTLVAGQPVQLPRGPWELARRTGATVIPMFSRRDWRDRFTVTVEEPFHVPCDGEESVAVHEAVVRFAGLLEKHLRREPGQWTIIEDFWSVHRCGEG
jgi:KDO2-lipid IV(A) lauroyltransferase